MASSHEGEGPNVGSGAGAKTPLPRPDGNALTCLQRLTQLMADLAGCADLPQLSRTTVDAAARSLGAVQGTLALIWNAASEPGREAGSEARQERMEPEQAADLPMDSGATRNLLEAAQGDVPCLLEAGGWRGLAREGGSELVLSPGAWLALPLLRARTEKTGQPPGVLLLRFERLETLDAAQQQMGMAIASAAGQAVGRLIQRPRYPEPGAVEASFDRLFHTSVVGLVVTDRAGRIHDANDAFLRLVGYSRADLEQGRLRKDELIAPEWEMRSRDAEAELRRYGVAAPFEKEYLRSDGRRVPVLVGRAYVPQWDRNLSFVFDISGRRRAVKDLRFLADASEHLSNLTDPDAALQRVAELAASSICTFVIIDMVRENGSLRRVAAAHRDPAMRPLMREALRFPPDSTPGRPPSPMPLRTELCVDGAPRSATTDICAPAHAALIERLDPRSRITVPLRAEGRAIGQIALYSSGAEPPLDEADATMAEELARRAVAALGNARLLRETRQQAELQQRLAEISHSYEERQSSLAPVLDEVTRSVSSLLGDISVLLLLGEQHELELRSVHALDPTRLAGILGRDSFREHKLSERVVTSGEPVLIPDFSAPEHRQKYAPEALAEYDSLGLRALVIVPLRAHGKVIGTLGAGRLGPQPYTHDELQLVQAIAERAALVIVNAQLLESSVAAVQMRDDFLSIASHELKTPLTPLILAVQSLRLASKGQPGSPFQERLQGRLTLMERQIHRLTSLINDLLDVSRITKGTLEMRLCEVDLSAVIGEAVEGFREEAAQNGSTLDFDSPGPLPGKWDRGRVEQVATNLLSNAIKYGDGKPIHVRLEQQEGFAVLSVKDQGIGIEPETLPHIFERFVRAKSGRNFGGLGLGLYITHEVVVAHGGTVEAQSELGKGSTFTVRLPTGR